MSHIMELIRETEHPANSFSPDVIKYAFEAHNDLQRLVEWCKAHKNSHIDYCGYYDQKACTCGWAEIQSLLGE